MVLRKSEIAGLQAVSEQDVKEGDNGIYLRESIGSVGVKQLESQQADAKAEEPAEDPGNAIPEGLAG